MSEHAVPSLADAFPEVRALGDALRASHRTVAVAESCTGGLLGAALTAFPGSSDFLLGGVIAYADDAKVAQLGVTRDALAAHLNANGVQTAVNYPTALPFLAAYSRFKHRPEQFPNARRDQDNILSLPMFAEITPEQQDEVIRLVREF